MSETHQIASDYHPESVSPVNSEKRLLAAILERVIMDIICDYADKRIKSDAIEWINAVPFDLGVLPFFSFPWICHHLNLDPRETLNKIEAIKYTPSKNRKSSYRSIVY